MCHVTPAPPFSFTTRPPALHHLRQARYGAMGCAGNEGRDVPREVVLELTSSQWNSPRLFLVDSATFTVVGTRQGNARRDM